MFGPDTGVEMGLGVLFWVEGLAGLRVRPSGFRAFRVVRITGFGSGWEV